jgi:ArsR family transcriptional regulator
MANKKQLIVYQAVLGPEGSLFYPIARPTDHAGPCGVQLDAYLYVTGHKGLSVVDAEQFQRIAKALADPRRVEILEHIAQQAEVGCRRLCGCFPVRQATISHHLKELASAGLVESRRDGQFVYYRTRPAVLDTYMNELRRRMALPAMQPMVPTEKSRVAKRA